MTEDKWNQKCVVNNKSQLLVAVGCAFDYFGTTEIILNNKTYIKIKPRWEPGEIEGDYDFWSLRRKIFHIGLKRILANIRKIPAECFRA